MVAFAGFVGMQSDGNANIYTEYSGLVSSNDAGNDLSGQLRWKAGQKVINTFTHTLANTKPAPTPVAIVSQPKQVYLPPSTPQLLTEKVTCYFKDLGGNPQKIEKSCSSNKGGTCKGIGSCNFDTKGSGNLVLNSFDCNDKANSNVGSSRNFGTSQKPQYFIDSTFTGGSQSAYWMCVAPVTVEKRYELMYVKCSNGQILSTGGNQGNLRGCWSEEVWKGNAISFCRSSCQRTQNQSGCGVSDFKVNRECFN